MAAKRQLGWQKLFLVLTVLPCCRTLEVFIAEGEYEVARGGDITLTCSFVPAQPDITKLVLTWGIDPENLNDPVKNVATYFLNTPVDIAPAYEGRAFMEVDLKQRVSTLRLTKVTMQDSRRFQCNVIIPGDDEGTTSALTFLLVLEPPSVPICRIQGTPEYWHNITLTCMSAEGSPKPTYEWRSYSVQNIPRQLPPKTTDKDGVLSLFNISRETSGFYICTSTNRIGSESCNYTLAVVPSSMNEASVAGIIGGVLAGLLVLGIVIFCCCRKKGKKDKYAEGAPGEVTYYDRDAPEAGEQYNDDKSNRETKEHRQYEDKDVVAHNSYNVGTAEQKFEDDQHSHNSGKDKNDEKDSDIDSQRYRDKKNDHYRGSRDHLDDQRDRYGGSQDRLDDRRDRYGGSQDRLDDRRDRYGGSQDRLDDRRNRYGGSRDRLDDRRDRDRYGGSRDRLDDRRDRDRYGGSHDRLDDRRDRYGGSRDRLDDQRDHFDDRRDRQGGSRDRLDDHRDHYGDNQHQYE